MKVEGIFALNKPIGMTSQRAVQLVKFWAERELAKNTARLKVKNKKQTKNTKSGNRNNKEGSLRKSGNKIKVGHGGTLDPLAEGVLVIAVGKKFTRQINEVVEAEKEYLAEIKLGEISTTDDAEGKKKIINQKKIPTEAEIKKELKKFIGHIEQVPPIYSAIKIQGKEAYKRARAGEKIEMKKRKVYIKKIKIIFYHYPVLKIKVTCGKGTYLRTLARDIGERLGTGAYLNGLRRTRVGQFTLNQAKSISDFTLKIALPVTELEQERIDGTRVYLNKMLYYFGRIDKDNQFFIYHKNKFNPTLQPPSYSNYFIENLGKFPFWTQTKFAGAIFRERPDVVWLPLHNLPRWRRPQAKYVVTIHDLAFKLFPESFPRRDLRKLNWQTDYAVQHSDKIIAVSKATKNDLLKFYPQLTADKIAVIPHGIQVEDWQKKINSKEIDKTLQKYNLNGQEYLIHLGAIQPRKNLEFLIGVFEELKKDGFAGKLVLAGGDGWKYEGIKKRVTESDFSADIIFTGNVPFSEARTLLRQAQVFVFPSLYEGFGLPGLEALASGVPVVSARNSSLPEVLGDCALYFNAENQKECLRQIQKVLSDKKLRQKLISQGLRRVQKFSWEKTARLTLNVLRRVK